MVPISFKGTSRAPSIDPVNLIPSTSAQLSGSEASFESHLKVTDEPKAARPSNQETADQQDDRSSDEHPVANDTSQSPQTDKKEDAPSEERKTDGPEASAKEKHDDDSNPDDQPTENNEATVLTELVVSGDAESSDEVTAVTEPAVSGDAKTSDEVTAVTELAASGDAETSDEVTAVTEPAVSGDAETSDEVTAVTEVVASVDAAEFDEAHSGQAAEGKTSNVTGQLHTETAEKIDSASSQGTELELFSDDASNESKEENADKVKPQETSRSVSLEESVRGEIRDQAADDAAQRAAAHHQQEQTAATSDGDRAAIRTRFAEHASSAGKPTAPQPVDLTEIAPLPDSLSQEAESYSEGRREGTGPPSLPQATPRENNSVAATNQRFAQHLVAQGGRGDKGTELNSADQARFVDRVARAFRAAEGRNGTVRLRLSPPELGSMRLEIKVQGGALAARLEADTPMARSLLMDNLTVLRERLAEQGIRVEQFDVELLDRHSNGEFDDWEQREQHPTEDGEPTDPDNPSRESSDESSSRELPGTRPGEDEQLNVVI